MHALSAAQTLDLHEQGAGLHRIDRALLLLHAAEAGPDPEAFARLPLGMRDALVLRVRRLTLGERVAAEARCPSCGERLEFELTCHELLARAVAPPPRWSIEFDGWRVALRPLDSVDAAAAARAVDADAARAVLLDRCVTAAERDGTPVSAAALPGPVQVAIASSLAEQDPGAEWLLDLDCPACGAHWQSPFEVDDFVWRELATHADRLLLEVHALARAYGWSEAEILALDPRRRAAYLALVAA